MTTPTLRVFCAPEHPVASNPPGPLPAPPAPPPPLPPPAAAVVPVAPPPPGPESANGAGGLVRARAFPTGGPARRPPGGPGRRHRLGDDRQGGGARRAMHRGGEGSCRSARTGGVERPGHEG